MARTDTLGNFLTDVAEAIRTKAGTSEPINASTFDTAIANIPSGGGGLDWSAIGYSSTPQSITDAYNYAVYIKENWTNDTSKLTDFRDVTIAPYVNLGNRTSLNYFASYCYSLIEMPVLDTSSITDMSYMFNYCYGIQKLPLLNTSNVTNMKSMFYYCSQITELPAYDTSNVTNMQAMLTSCEKLEIVPQLNTSKVTTMNGMFSACSKLNDESLNNILKMCINTTSAYTRAKTLKELGFASYLYSASKIQGLSEYQNFIDAGWTIGY